jgi:hypothetical protein
MAQSKNAGEVMSTAPKNTPHEDDLLVQFERDNIPAEYREYYAIKRNNFFASIQGFREMWEYYIRLDSIWLRGFSDLKTARDPERMFPLLMYFNAHAKIRVAIELAFSGCMAEARSILRDAIEFVAHAHAMVNDPQLQTVWLSKNDGKAALEAFKDGFERHKKDGLFKGLDELHKTWGELSEAGSHANINATCDRFVQITSEDHVEFNLNYTGLEPRLWGLSLFSLLLTCATMEQTFFNDYDSRLNLDDQLRQMRAGFEGYKEQLREQLKIRYLLEPPGGVHRPQRPVIYRP